MNLTLDKGLNVLECLAGRAEPMSVGQIASAINAPSSTVYRILETLKVRGYVQQEQNRGDYSAGLRVLGLSAEILNRMELRRKAGPYLHRLTEESGCSAYVAAASNGNAVMIMTYHPGGKVSAALGEIGTVNSCQCTAMGKLVAAHLSSDEQLTLLEETELVAKTPDSIINRQILKKEWDKTLTSGIGHSRYENSTNIHGIAVPVCNYEGTLIAALGLAVPRSLDVKHGIEHFEELLRNYGEQLSFALGYAAETFVIA